MIVGIDPAMRSLAVFSEKFAEKICVNKSASKKLSRAYEISALHDILDELIQSRRSYPDEPVHLFIESPIQGGSGNVQTSVKIAMTVGAVYSLGYPIDMVAPASWKMAVLGKGKGHATKEEVGYWLKESHPAYSEQCDGDQDLIDATCIYLYGVQQMDLQ